MIIGITGTNGSGKGTIVEYLVKKHGFVHLSVGDFLKKQLIKQNKEINRTSLQNMGNKLRNKFGPDFITKELFKEALRHNQDVIIESIRNPKEAKFILRNGGYLIAVDADQKLRYKRITARGSEKDFVTFEEFKVQERREFQETDSNAQNLPKFIEMENVTINNNGTVKKFHEKIKKAIKKII